MRSYGSSIIRCLGVMLVAGVGAISLAQTASISGAVTDTASGDGIAGATIVLLERAGSAGGGSTPVDTVTSGPNGVYTIDNIDTAGEYSVMSTAVGYTPKTVRVSNLRADSTTTVDFELVSSGPLTSSISGTVTAGNTPIPGATVVLSISSASGHGGGSAWISVDSATTASNGAYAFTSLAAGTYRIQVTATGYVQNTSGNLVLAADQELTHDVSLRTEATALRPAASGLASARSSAGVRSVTIDGRVLTAVVGAALPRVHGIRVARAESGAGSIVSVR